MKSNLSTQLCEDIFMYGNHVIKIKIEIVSETFDSTKRHVKCLHEYNHQFDIYRKVTIYAWEKGEKPDSLDDSEVYHQVYAALDTSQETHEEPVGLLGLRRKTITEGQKPIPVREHVHTAVEPVLSRLDEFYKFSHQNVDVEINVTMDEIVSKTSWGELPHPTRSPLTRVAP